MRSSVRSRRAGRGFGRHVEHDCQIGRKSVGGYPAYLPKRFRVEPPGAALVDDIGQQEAVADHRFADGQGRADDLFDQLRTSSHVEEHFATTVDAQIVAHEQQFADRLAQSGAAGVATGERIYTKTAKPPAKQFDLG